MKVSEIISSVIVPAYEEEKNKVGYAAFRWYRGILPDGTTTIFRFSKGGSPTHFADYVAAQGFVDVDGPFKTRIAAKIV